MKKLIIILGVVLGLISCTQTKYIVKSDSDLSRIDLKQNILNYIPLMDKDLSSSKILDSTYNLLTLRKYSKLNNYLSSVQSNSPDYYLAQTLYLISKTKYQDATTYLMKIDENSYTLLKQLLFIDLNYEIAKINGSKDFKKFLQNYQALIDKYSDNEQLKQIVSIRTRYIRYNY
jgi:hypothetical protein